MIVLYYFLVFSALIILLIRCKDCKEKKQNARLIINCFLIFLTVLLFV